MATYESAETQYVTVQDVRFAYRKLGIVSGVPLVFFMHFRLVFCSLVASTLVSL